MAIKYFEPDADSSGVIAALRKDGAVIIKNAIEDTVADAVLAELRDSFDKKGKFDEDDFN